MFIFKYYVSSLIISYNLCNLQNKVFYNLYIFIVIVIIFAKFLIFKNIIKKTLLLI